MIISFAEGEVTPDQAFQIVGEFVERYLGKEYEAVYVIHDNTAHIHGHIIFNSISFVTGKKYRYEKGDWAKYIQPITNELCSKYGLSTITIEEDQALSHDTYDEWKEKRDGRFVWSDMIARDIDACIILAHSYEEFLGLLSDRGYAVKEGKHLAVKPPGMNRYRRCNYFGSDYTKERIMERISSENEASIQTAKIVRVTVPYRLRRAKLSGLQRSYFAKLYRLGRLKKKPYSQAWKYRDEIKRMHRLHDEYMFLSDYGVQTKEDLSKAYDTLAAKKDEAGRERRHFYRERARFRGLFKKLDRIETLSFAVEAFNAGDSYFVDEKAEYDRLMEELKDAGYTPDELKKIREDFKQRSESIRLSYADARSAYNLAKRLMADKDIGYEDVKSIDKDIELSRK